MKKILNISCILLINHEIIKNLYLLGIILFILFSIFIKNENMKSFLFRINRMIDYNLINLIIYFMYSFIL